MSARPKILIVDDKKENLYTLRMVLKGIDAELIEAESGNDALTLTLHHEFALAILDVQMPVMSGYELAECLRSEEKTTNIPIIFLSAVYSDAHHVFKGYESGAVDFITKPYEPKVLLSKISVLLQLHREKVTILEREEKLQKDKGRLENLEQERTASLQESNQLLEKKIEELGIVQEKLIESEKQYFDLYDNAPDMFASVEARSERIVNCNKTLAQETGYSKDEIIGRPILDMYHPDCLKEAHRAFAKFVGTGEVHNVDLQLRRKDGSRIDVILNASAVRDIESKILYSRSIWRDITEFKLTDANLQKKTSEGEESLKELNCLYQISKLAVSLVDRSLPEILQQITETIPPAMQYPDRCYARISFEAHQYETVHLIETENKLESDIFVDGRKSGSVAVYCLEERAAANTEPFLDEERQLIAGVAQHVGQIIARKLAGQQLAIRNRINGVFLTVPDDQMYAEVLEVVLETMESPYGVFGYIDQAGGDLVVPSMPRHIREQCQVPDKQLVFPRETWGETSWHRAIKEKKSNFTNEKSALTPKEHIVIERHISMPILHQDEVIGLLQIANKKTDYTASDVAKLESIGNVVALVLHARLERERNLAALQLEKKMQAGAAQVLTILAQPTRQLDAVNELLALIREFTDIEAVGIRLQVDEDFPYYQTKGFPQEFVEMESRLCGQDPDGGILRDDQGKALLECLCGTVISNRTDPCKPFFTKAGSFWTNSTTDLLASISEEDRQAITRNRCHSTGYESVALVPLHTGSKTIGLLQLNDRRRDMFNAAMIEFFEGLAASIGVSLARRAAEAELLESERQLVQAQKMEAVGRLAGGVAHDFNNMLSVINGYADLALSSLSPDDPLYKDIEEIHTAGKRSAKLTRQLLAFARKETVNPMILNLNDILDESQKMLARLIGEDIELRIVPAADLWNISIDPSQIDQIIANLAVNARDAISGVGSITLETNNVVLDAHYCRQHLGFVPGKFVMLSFSDSGHGMDKETQEHIFEPFFTTKAEGKGTGLGLSTVFGIVKQNNGFMNVYSESGKGAIFKIYLPGILGDTDKVSEPAEEKILKGTETVLIVEDEEQILGLAQRILEKLGYTTLTALSPGEACLLVEKYDNPIHLLLTDVVMPGMNGKELQKRIEAMKPNIKTIFMSGYTADIIVHRGVLAKGTQFVQKPFSRETMARKVRAVLDAGVVTAK